eukprot:m.12751 g.12751  ORF g.12751 m.12751 type:complete len:370 (+) comp8190_c1_seq1:46-1155(+)
MSFFKKKASKKETLFRRGNFMTQPAAGWLHEEKALKHGHGVYYCFPVKYIGSIQVLESLRGLDLATQSELCAEAISRCIEGAKLRKPSKRKVPKNAKQFLADAPYIKVMDLKLNISCEGIATSDLQKNQIISNDDIGRISFASGGSPEDYDYVTYVAKDRRDNRYCHVFDCAKLSDDVLATLGQAFCIIKDDVDDGPKGVAALQQAPKIKGPMEGGDNPMYFEGSKIQQQVAGDNPSYFEGNQLDNRPPPETYDNAPPSRPAPNAPEDTYDNAVQPTTDEYDNFSAPVNSSDTYDNNVPQEDIYDNANPEDLVNYLNTNISTKHIYGDDVQDAPPQEGIYGDGTGPGWEYLALDKEETQYGALTDVLYG